MQCSNRDGKGRQCTNISASFKTCARCRERGRTNRKKARLDPETAAFEQFINKHGFREDHPKARELAKWIADPLQACAICGVTNRFLKTLQRTNGPFPHFGDAAYWRRLQPDHIDPKEKGSPHAKLRPLCQGCNGIRGAGRFSDEEVLIRIRREWTKIFPEKHLRWLK